MQQSGYDEMQFLQQQVMLKQLHALQSQQQNFLNPYSSTVPKQASNSGQFQPLHDAMPLNDSSPGYLNWGQRNAFPGQQGTLDKTMFSMGLGSQQPDISLYGTPVANARGSTGQQPPIQVMYQEPNSLAARPPSGQSQKSLMQSSGFNNPFLKSQYGLSPAQLPLQQQGAFMSNLGVQGRGMSEAGLSNGIHSGNFLSQQFDTSSKGSSRRQEEQASWSSFQQKGSQGLVPLDPLEEKILFDMEDSSISEIASGVFGDKFDSVNISSSFPSMHSGSWSALMQTAVAEASSSDTGLQEEFSGLTYQNMELPADINDISNFLDSDKQQAGCVNNNNTLLGSSSLNASFPGFQVPSDQLRSSIFQDDSTPDSTKRSSNVTGHWVDCNPQPMISTVSFDNISTGNMYMQSSGMQSQTGNYSFNTADSSASHLAGMSSQGGKWMNAPGQLGKEAMFPQFIQQNEPATVTVSQMHTTSPFVASQPENATFPGVILDGGIGGHTFNPTRSPQQGTNQQFNVWMDLPTRHYPSDQQSLKFPLNSTSPVERLGSDVSTSQKAQHMSSTAYNMPQRVGLPQEQGAAAKNDSDFTAPNKDFNRLQGENNVDFGSSLKSYGQNYGFKMPVDNGMSSMSQLESFVFDDPKMEQNVCSSGSSHLNLPTSAPVWFKQMGAVRNDQMQPAHDSQETRHFKPLNTMDKHAEIIAPKKRKLMRTRLLGWNEEASNASQRDHTISEREQEWARVSNLLVEKAEYDTQTFEFAPPLHRSKRRLVLTSKLLRQLFDPPPSFKLSAASSSYDILLFFVARATLGNACSLTHKRENVLPSSSYEVDKIPEKIENFERKDVQHSEVAKKLSDQAKKLEESFERDTLQWDPCLGTYQREYNAFRYDSALGN
ncbi:unnamed protein product [Thlaspi arvense]|uniref:Uncharacterized protein n=1 Tax=Thlaspi arvense TaxID=13288 RepID=A0AAU9SZ94_THLAR|nr:unnamed protein product [Thlaspi arvense]